MTMVARRLALIALLFSLVLVAARAQESPLPLDPLTPREREIAASLVREDARVREALGPGRVRLIYVDFIAIKSPEDSGSPAEQPPRRRVDALFYRYDEDIGIRALVDLEKRAVVDVARVRGGSVPLSLEEVEEAARLAMADARVRRLVGERLSQFHVATGPATADEVNSDRIEGLRVLGTSSQDPCYRHRCVVLFFRSKNRYEFLNRVVVDLTSQKVQVREGGQ